MNLRQLHYFRVLAKMEHITRAAEILNITQPSLSHSISELEKELGTYLFEKQGRNIRITKYGLFYLDYVNRALEELEKGEKNLRELTSPSTGRVDLAFIYTLGPFFIPALVKEFNRKEEYKNITFTFHQGVTKNIIQELKNDQCDVAFCSFVEHEPEIEFTPLLEQEIVLIVPNNHPLSNKDSIDLVDTTPYPYVYFSESSGLRPYIDQLFETVGVKPSIACTVEEDHTMVGLVSAGYGIAVMPRITSLKHYQVKALPIVNPKQQRFIYLATVKNRYLSPAACQFRDFASQFAKEYSIIDSFL